MIKQAVLNAIINLFDIDKIEKHLIYSFIENNNLDFQDSPILKEYFKDFNRDPRLYLEISLLEISDLKMLERYLELLIPKEDRKINGAFFTPSYIVEFIISRINPKEDSRCLDPSCGCGAFLLGLIDHYRKEFNKDIRYIVKENIFGIDILDYNIHRTKILVSLLALLNKELLEEDDFNLINHDSLRANWQKCFRRNPEGKFEIILGNPPYVKFHDLSDDNRKFLSGNWQTIKNGTFNLYFAFFEQGYKLLTLDGKLGYITPNNYFTSLAGEALRKFFQKTKCVNSIIDFSCRKVFDAQTYTAITFIDKEKNSDIYYARIEQDQNPEEFVKTIKSSPNKTDDLSIKKWRLLKKTEQENIRLIENSGTPLGKLVNVFVGIATLKDELYFLDDRKKDNGFYLKTIEGKTFKIEAGITRQIYKISDFNNQDDVFLNTRRIIFPYKKQTNRAIALSENEMGEKFPLCLEYFHFIKDKLKARDKGKNKIVPFYAYGRSQGLTKTGKKILTPTFSKYPRFLIGDDENALFCNGYGILLKQDNENYLFDCEENPLSKSENIDVLQKILNSYVMYYYVSKTSVSIDGGYPCYQKNFIERFSVPHLSGDELTKLRSLHDINKVDEFLIEKYQLNLPVPNLLS